MQQATVTRDDRSTFARLTEGLYWCVVLGVLLVLATLPTLVLWMLLAQAASNLPLYLASAVCVPPALAAALFAWRTQAEDPDPVPARVFWRGYRLNLLDSLQITVPGVVVLTVLATNITFGEAVGTGALSLAFVVLAGMVALVTVRALSIVSAFSFRFRDVLRLTVFTLLMMPLRTLALVSLGVLTAGISVLVGDYTVVLLASVLTFVLYQSERPVLARLRADFVAEDAEVLPGG